METVALHLTREEADSLLAAVAWIRYHSNDIYPDVGSIQLFKAHLALCNALQAASPTP